MNLSQRGLDFIKQWEGFRNRPYDDGYGNLTIGYGHLIKRGESFGQISSAEAEALLSRDVAGAVATVNSLVRAPLTQAMFDALVSLVFNWGSGNFGQSTHLRFLNAGDYTAAARRLGEFPNTSGGKFSQGLTNRRAAESSLFLSEGIPGDSSPAPAVTPDDDSAGSFSPGGYFGELGAAGPDSKTILILAGVLVVALLLISND